MSTDFYSGFPDSSVQQMQSGQVQRIHLVTDLCLKHSFLWLLVQQLIHYFLQVFQLLYFHSFLKPPSWDNTLLTHSLAFDKQYLQLLSATLEFTVCLCVTIVCFAAGTERLLLALRGKKLNKKGYFSPPCKQLAASHACTINGHLIGNNHFYLSKFKIGSCPWNKQLLVEPSGNIAWMFEEVADQCLQEVVHT